MTDIGARKLIAELRDRVNALEDKVIAMEARLEPLEPLAASFDVEGDLEIELSSEHALAVSVGAVGDFRAFDAEAYNVDR